MQKLMGSICGSADRCFSSKQPADRHIRPSPAKETFVLHSALHLRGESGTARPSRLVNVASTNPAKIFKLFPRKGSIQPRSDADLVVYDPEYRGKLSAKTHLMNIDYNAFEDWPSKAGRRSSPSEAKSPCATGNSSARSDAGGSCNVRPRDFCRLCDQNSSVLCPSFASLRPAQLCPSGWRYNFFGAQTDNRDRPFPRSMKNPESPFRRPQRLCRTSQKC